MYRTFKLLKASGKRVYIIHIKDKAICQSNILFVHMCVYIFPCMYAYMHSVQVVYTVDILP